MRAGPIRESLRRFATAATMVVAIMQAPCPAADRPASAPVFPTHLDEVHLTVTVHDAGGRIVSDLEAGDFQVFEEGRLQKIQVFGRALEPGQEERLALDLGLLMDTSASMLTELKLSQQAAVRFLEAIPRARDLFTIFFDDIRVSRYNSENQQRLFERILDMKPGGNTALYDAISVYLSRVQGGQGRNVLVLFTDGEDTRSAIGLSEVLELVRASGVVIYPIAFTNSLPSGSTRAVQSRAALSLMAAMTGGEVFTPRSSRDLGGIYDRILQALRAQYVLGFVSDDPRHDGKFRRVKVEVKEKRLRVRHRAGYYPG